MQLIKRRNRFRYFLCNARVYSYKDLGCPFLIFLGYDIHTCRYTKIVVAEGGFGVYEYSWNFGEGSDNATVKTGSHDYLLTGAYAATVTVTGKSDDAIASLSVTVVDPITDYKPVSIESTPVLSKYSRCVLYAGYLLCYVDV